MSEVSHCATSSERMNVVGTTMMTIAMKTHHGNPSSSSALDFACVPEVDHPLYFIVRYSVTNRHTSTNAKGATGRGGAAAAAWGCCDFFSTRSCAALLSSRSSTSDATGPPLLAAAPPFRRQLIVNRLPPLVLRVMSERQGAKPPDTK